MDEAPKFLKNGHVNLTMPLSWMVCHPQAMIKLCDKSEVSTANCYEYMKGDAKCRKQGVLG